MKTSTPFSREHHDWTAHEALEQLFPLALEWSPDAEVMHVCSSPLEGTADEREATGVWIDDRGRTTLTGGWSVTFKSATRGQFANLSLVIPTARVVRLADTFPHYEFTGELRDDWIDSSAVIALTEPMYAARRSGETPRLHHRGLDLRMTEQGSRWRVLYMCWERGKERVDFEFLIDARSGEVLPA